MKRLAYHLAGVSLIGLIALSSGTAQPTGARPTCVRQAMIHDISLPLREMPILTASVVERHWETEEVPNPSLFLSWNRPTDIVQVATGRDPAIQSQSGWLAPTGTLVNIDGVGDTDMIAPPDPNGDVGQNHFFQTVNTSFAIYSTTGALVFGPARLSTIWQGLPYPSDGDPIVLYDHLADRWLISQFSFPNYPSGPGYELVAVSQTGDPLGAWYRYVFQFTNTPDYPKFAVWPDGYYMSVNSVQFGTGKWLGPAAVVLERDSMLLGRPARMMLFQQGATLFPMLPADLDGPSPPSGSPGLFMSAIDDAFGGGVDRLELYQLHVDWADSANSTFAAAAVLPTAPFDMNMCGGSRNCIPQRGTARKVDALAMDLMNRLQYRNFGSHQVLVTNHTVDVDGTDHAGIRWYEVRNPGNGWTIYQQGTYAPDAAHRWMGSAAMDGQGNIALGYSVSSDSIFPSIRATARRATDPPGQMTFAEETIVAGGGAQSMTEGRWGDYSMLSVDPSDDETFWYTNEYYATSGQLNWLTRIASFKVSTLSEGAPGQQPVVPVTVALSQNYPNPFNPATLIRYTIAGSKENGVGSKEVKLVVHDILGREVAVLVNERKAPGLYSVRFDASGLASGVYFYRLTAGTYVESRKMVLIR